MREKRSTQSSSTLCQQNCCQNKGKKQFPCQTRTGMSCAVDTAWHKRGFNSLTFRGGQFSHITLIAAAELNSGQFPHITLIAAAELNSGHSFNTYVLPKTLITSTAQQVTGIVMSGSNCMSVNGMPVEAEFKTTSLEKFCKWLEQSGGPQWQKI